MPRRKPGGEADGVAFMPVAGAIAHGAPLERCAPRELVAIRRQDVDAAEAIYRVASSPRGLGLHRGDLLVVEPRDHAATAELVIASLADCLFIGRWWGKHDRRAVMDAALTPLVEDAAVRVVGAVTVVIRFSPRPRSST